MSIFEDGQLKYGTGKGKRVKESYNQTHVIDDQGNVSFYRDGKLMSGTGKGKTKTKTGSTEKDNPEKYRKEKLKYVTDQIKAEQANLPYGTSLSQEDHDLMRKKFGTLYDSEVKGWPTKYLPTGQKVFVKEDVLIDEYGNIVARVKNQGTSPFVMKKSH